MVSAATETPTQQRRNYYESINIALEHYAPDPELMARKLLTSLMPLQALIDYPQLFNKNSPPITPESLKLVPGLPKSPYFSGIYSRINHLTSLGVNTNEQMSPFRVNTYVDIFAMIWSVIKDTKSVAQHAEKFHDWVGENFDLLLDRIKDIQAVTTEKKIHGQRVNALEFRSKHYPSSIDEQQQSMSLAAYHAEKAPITQYEARRVFSLGNLVLRYLGDGTEHEPLGMPLSEAERQTLLADCLGININTQKD